jgi:hypothetical protein
VPSEAARVGQRGYWCPSRYQARERSIQRTFNRRTNDLPGRSRTTSRSSSPGHRHSGIWRRVVAVRRVQAGGPEPSWTDDWWLVPDESVHVTVTVSCGE